ncbi:MAG: MvaI/BcnI restriction endonuclease family protein [Treponema sp.]|jgi:hypothetical protein|nr:MvaI/BcnI restriction endonuclease family protein [Treponema sp.]
MYFDNFEQLGRFFLELGVTRAFFKPLSENDNTKQQIYLGSSFQVLQQIPFGTIREYPENKDPNYKASVDFWWINDHGQTSHAPNTQLILYTRYPEVRLSGFLSNCPTAPREHLQPLKREERASNNGKDGRVLIFGICPDNKVYGFLAIKNSPLAKSILTALYSEDTGKTIQEFPIKGVSDTDKSELINRLHDIVNSGWHESVRLDINGNIRLYKASNGGGYTLEALFGIIPNGIAEPDFKGWELKTFSGTRITLMTPEPDQGFYHEVGAKEFTLKYGHDAPNVIKYFTGTHKVNVQNPTSKMTLAIKGYDLQKGTINDMSGGLYLLDNNNNPTAIWSFNGLITHWSRKHSKACYVKCKTEEKNGKIGYVYYSPVYLGEETDLTLFLKTMQSGLIVYDPATKVLLNAHGKTSIKARSQFRINFANLENLYERFYEQNV